LCGHPSKKHRKDRRESATHKTWIEGGEKAEHVEQTIPIFTLRRKLSHGRRILYHSAFCCHDKIPEKNDLREERFILAHSSTVLVGRLHCF
jgi:hypothetical protein